MARAVLESVEEAPAHPNAVKHDDPERARGIPIIGPGGLGGQITSSRPLIICAKCGKPPRGKRSCRCPRPKGIPRRRATTPESAPVEAPLVEPTRVDLGRVHEGVAARALALVKVVALGRAQEEVAARALAVVKVRAAAPAELERVQAETPEPLERDLEEEPRTGKGRRRLSFDEREKLRQAVSDARRVEIAAARRRAGLPRDACAGCDALLEDETLGCRTCAARAQGRRKRERARQGA